MKNMKVNMKEISKSVKALYNLQQQKKDFDKYYNETRKKEQLAISNFMFSNLKDNVNTFDIGVGDKSIKVTKVRTKKIIWDIEKLKQRIPKKLIKQFVNKTYTINNMQGLIEYLKQCGVDARKFKKFIEVTEEVDNDKLNNLSELGEIKAKDLNGCYELQLGEPYIKITEMKQDAEEI